MWYNRPMVRFRHVSKDTVALAIIVFFVAGFAGMSHLGMTIQADGQMSACPFTPGISICNMNSLEMIAASQSLLNALPQQKDVELLFLLLIAGAFAFLFFWKSFSPPKISVPHNFSRHWKYIPPHNPLQELFSSGILNPKPY